MDRAGNGQRGHGGHGNGRKLVQRGARVAWARPRGWSVGGAGLGLGDLVPVPVALGLANVEGQQPVVGAHLGWLTGERHPAFLEDCHMIVLHLLFWRMLQEVEARAAKD